MMATYISEIISSAFQVLIFSLIPFLVWLLTARKKQSFFQWIGLKKVTSNKKECAKVAVCIFVICEIVGLIVYKLVLVSEWNRSSFSGMGIAGVPGVILYAFIHTAFSEEILFRGFIQKRLQSIMDFKLATLIQAVLFGFSHIVLILDRITFVQGVALVLYPIIPGILMAYINEKKADGSVIPSWLIHGSLNILTNVIQL